MRSVVVIPTVLATLQICRISDGGMPTCEAGVTRDGEFIQCGDDATTTRRDDGDPEAWPCCDLHRTAHRNELPLTGG